MPEIFTGEHSLITAIMVVLILGAFLTISLVMLWAPSRPFPGYNEDAKPRPKQSPERKTQVQQGQKLQKKPKSPRKR